MLERSGCRRAEQTRIVLQASAPHVAPRHVGDQCAREVGHHIPRVRRAMEERPLENLDRDAEADDGAHEDLAGLWERPVAATRTLDGREQQ